jgi:D-aminopeptidase
MQPGPRNSLTDIPGVMVGQSEDQTLKSGVTVVMADAPMVVSVSVMGGAPGTRETDLLEPDKLAPAVDALVLSGGSAFGLDAAGGVVDRLREMGRGFEVGPVRVPIVPAAIIFDLINGGDKGWTTNPYPALGRKAIDSLSGEIRLGSHGAGTGALTARMKGGTGTASLEIGNGVTVAALMIANPIGSPCTKGDRHFWAAPFELGREFGGVGPDPASGLVDPEENLKYASLSRQANTTIGVVATNARLTKAQAKRVAIAAHDGIARAVMPSHTPVDGDLIFAASTGEGRPADDEMMRTLCNAAAHCVARSIARAVYEARPAPGDTLRCWSDLNGSA